MTKEIAVNSTDHIDPMLDLIERVATDPNTPIDRLTALMDMRERQMNKEAEQIFNQAFAEAMAEMPNVPRNGKNNHTGQKYSTLDDLICTTRPVLARHGLSLNWQNAVNGNEIHVTAIVRHALGHNIQTMLTGPRDTGKQMNVLQGGGSTETYLKRYSGFSILGLSSGDEIDDDGRGASGGTVSAEQYVALRDKVDEAGADLGKMLGAYKAQSLEMFPAKSYADAMANLERKIAKNKEAA